MSSAEDFKYDMTLQLDGEEREREMICCGGSMI